MESIDNNIKKATTWKAPACVHDRISKDNNINFLRLFLAYMVVFFHSAELSGSSYPFSKFFDGEIAVYGFFIISGFLIIRSYWSSPSLKDYYIRRSKRLLPAYFIVVIGCIVFLSYYSSLSTSDYFKSSQTIKYFFSNIIFLNFLQPSLPGVFAENRLQAVNGSLWTIKVEVCFYVILPIIGHLMSKLKTKFRMNLLLCFLYVFGLAYKFLCLHIAEKSGNKIFVELSRQLPGAIQYFAVGIFCAVNYELIRKYEKYLVVPAIIIVAIYYALGNWYLLPIGLGVIVMYIGFNFKRLNGIGKIGDYSYGVYIFHFPIIQILTSLGYFKLNKDVTLLVVLGLVFSISYLSWHFLEKKVLKR